MVTFTPELTILPAEQQALWRSLRLTPVEFTLYGGTALALRYGHRESVDFDFFASCDIEGDALLQSVPYLDGAVVRQSRPNTLTVSVGGVMISFFGMPWLKPLATPEKTADIGLPVASVRDILAAKLQVIQKRAAWKDYVDIATILEREPYTLTDGLRDTRSVYGDDFNAMVSLKALTYFQEPGLERVSAAHRDLLVKAAQQVDLVELYDADVDDDRPPDDAKKDDRGR